MLIDPFAVNHLDRTLDELEAFAIFCVAVANKPAIITAKKVNAFLTPRGAMSPLTYVDCLHEHGMLEHTLVVHKLSPYRRVSGALIGLAEVRDRLTTITVPELEQIYGIGAKTARYFVMYSRPSQRHAVLDVHVLRYLREKIGIPTPASTPARAVYARLEKLWLDWCDRNSLSPTEADTLAWTTYARRAA